MNFMEIDYIMDKDTEESIGKVLNLVMHNALEIGKLYQFIEQHSDVINGNKDKTQISIEQIEKQLKAIQNDMDRQIDLYHKLETIPNMLSVLQDFKQFKENEKSKTD